MNAIHTLSQIRTSAMIKSFRAVRHLTGKSQRLADLGRLHLQQQKRLDRITAIQQQQGVNRERC